MSTSSGPGAVWRARWRAVEHETGLQIPDTWQAHGLQLLAERGLAWVLLTDRPPYGESEPDQARTDAHNLLVSTTRTLLLGTSLPFALSPRPPLETDDGRWELLSELQEVGHERFGIGRQRGWEPVRAGGPFLDTDSMRSIGDRRVLFLAIDTRMSLRSLIAWLRRLWPTLIKDGLVRKTHTFADRSLPLVRFVCLETRPDMPWPERLQQWNDEKPSDWHFKDYKQMSAQFHRLERQLTHRAYGLAVFYETATRVLLSNPGAFDEACNRGETDFLRVRKRQWAENGWFDDMGLNTSLEYEGSSLGRKQSREKLKRALLKWYDEPAETPQPLRDPRLFLDSQPGPTLDNWLAKTEQPPPGQQFRMQPSGKPTFYGPED